MNTITLNLDLEVNAHDLLDYQLRYKKYLNAIWMLGGYIVQQDFLKKFYEKERTLKEIIKELLDANWLGTLALGKYNVLYLKRKSVICIKQKNGQTDLKAPTMSQILRSIMLSQIINLNSNKIIEFKGIMEILKDTYVTGFLNVNDELGNPTKCYNVVVLDITKKNTNKLLQHLQDILNADFLQNKRFNITFCSYGERVKVLEKFIMNERVQNFTTIDYLQNKGKDALNINTSGDIRIDKLEIFVKELDVLKYFNNREPV